MWTKTVWRRLLVAVMLTWLWPGGMAVAAPRIDVGTCIAPAAGIGDQPDIAVLFRSPGRFDCSRPQSRYGAGDFWVLSAPLPTSTPASDLTLRTASLWQQRTTLYVLDADGHITRDVATSRQLTRHIDLGAMVDWPLAGRAAPVRLLWHIEGATNLRGVLTGAQLLEHEAIDSSNMLYGSFYAAFGGLCLALFIYHFALWGATRYRFQLSYCCFLVALGGYALSSSGALAWLMPDIDNNDRLRANYALLALSAVAALNFARHYFERHVFRGALRFAYYAVVATMLVSAAGVVLLAPWLFRFFDALYLAAFAELLLFAPFAAWWAWRMRSAFRWMFAICWSAPMLLGAARLASGLGLIGWSVLIDNSTLLAMVMETMLSSIAIAYRIHLLSRERDEARAHEIAARLLADADPLTGLLNRRAFLKEAIGLPGERVLLILDIDHFKRVNDTIGHDGGDEVLRVFARTLRAVLPTNALIARLGGEEFAVVLSPDQAGHSDRLIDEIRAARMPFDLTVTASVGACIGPLASELDWKMLYRAADRALFDAKAAGRDRVRRAPDQPARAAA